MTTPAPCALIGKCGLKAAADEQDHVQTKVKSCPDICLLSEWSRQVADL